MLQFNSDDALAFLIHIFGDATEGKVELAWTDPTDKKLRHAEHFDVGNLDALVERAAEVNTDEGVNVYFGAALRHPNSAPFGRAGDADFYMAPAVWADIDDSAAVLKIKEKWIDAPPTTAIFTGKTPGPRAQLWWRLSEPCDDPDKLKSINAGLARSLGGDPAVVNPSRVMALPGSIKWPIKEGRVVEAVTLVKSPNRPPPYFIEQLEKVYCTLVAAAEKKDFGVNSNTGVDPEKLLAEIGPGNVNAPLLRVVGHCVGKGYEDWAIQQLVAPYLDKGNEARTAADVEAMIDGARRKFDKPEPPSNERLKKPKQGGEFALSRPELHSEPVDGIDLLEGLATAVRRYVVLGDHAANAAALWIVYAHAFEAFYHSPRMLITSPQKRCGKTTLRSVIQRLVPVPLPAENITTAALFRSIEAAHPTVLLDEADRFLKQNEELVGVINAGHTRDGQVIRTVGDGHDVRAFSAWCPLVISGIGRVPDTIEDRSIAIPLERKKPSERVTRLRMDRTPDLDELVSKASRWADDNGDRLRVIDPDMPTALNDRAADNWRPLIAIADVVGGGWPDQARAAALALSGKEIDDSPAVDLLQDIKDIFQNTGEDRLPTTVILNDLHALEERPWPEWRNGKPITARQLARLLAPFGIAPTTFRTKSGTTPKGYLKTSFNEVWVRYLSPSATTQQTPETSQLLQNLSATQPLNVADREDEKRLETAECCGVADEKGGKAQDDDRERFAV